jgi:response regulator RpfG family c-di-GMP phosphodiesterase
MEDISKVFLVVEDCEQDTFLISKKIRKVYENAIIILASNGKTALEKLIEFVPNFIILDINMPIMSGYDFLESHDRIKSLKSDHSKIIVLSNIDPDPKYNTLINALDNVILLDKKPLEPWKLSAACANN